MLTRLGAVSLTLTVSVLLGSASLPVPALADQAVATATTSTAADLAFVNWIRKRDPREIVRLAARTALDSSQRDRAVAQFLASGYASAVNRAAATRARNLDFAKRVLAATSVLASPEVHAAAQFAVDGTDADQAYFVRTEYSAAKARDRAVRMANATQHQAITESDRRFVVGLCDTDPGEQVKVSAKWATRDGATEADLVEFFAHGWMNGASLDHAAYHTKLADSDNAWRRSVEQLRLTALAAETAAAELAGEAAALERAKALRAWQSIAEKADPAASVWADAEAVAAAQAVNWSAVLEAATAASGPNWALMMEPAATTATLWAGESSTAAEQRALWVGLYDEALRGQVRNSAPAQ